MSGTFILGLLIGFTCGIPIGGFIEMWWAQRTLLKTCERIENIAREYCEKEPDDD